MKNKTDIMNILPVIVTYCTDYETSVAYQHLFRFYPDCQLLIYDNSPTSINMKYANNNCYYIHNASNGGVTTAYNAGAKVAHELGKSYIALFDQDTRFEKNYLDVLEQAISDHPSISTIVPTIIYDTNKPFSPVKVGLCQIKAVCLRPGVYSLNDYMPVNSGACLRLDTFNQAGGYNELIKLDFSDYDFFQRLGQVYDRFLLLESRGYQKFSNNETDIEKLMHRFHIYINDSRHYQGQYFIGLHVLRHTVSLALRGRSLSFILYYIRHYLFYFI